MVINVNYEQCEIWRLLNFLYRACGTNGTMNFKIGYCVDVVKDGRKYLEWDSTLNCPMNHIELF